jgi:hypothetical protein
VPRDAEKYRKFVESAYFSKDREDPYTHFYLKEAKNKELVKTLISEENQRHAEFEADSRDTELKEDGKVRRQKLQDKIEDILLSEELQNQDLFDLSSAGLKTEVNVRYDMRTLVKSEFIHDIDPDLSVEAGLSAEEYLALSRRRAEAKLIKSKIIYKINQGAALSNNEKAYMKQWVGDIRTGKDAEGIARLKPIALGRGTCALEAMFAVLDICYHSNRRDEWRELMKTEGAWRKDIRAEFHGARQPVRERPLPKTNIPAPQVSDGRAPVAVGAREVRVHALHDCNRHPRHLLRARLREPRG